MDINVDDFEVSDKISETDLCLLSLYYFHHKSVNSKVKSQDNTLERIEKLLDKIKSGEKKICFIYKRDLRVLLIFLLTLFGLAIAVSGWYFIGRFEYKLLTLLFILCITKLYSESKEIIQYTFLCRIIAREVFGSKYMNVLKRSDESKVKVLIMSGYRLAMRYPDLLSSKA